MELAIAAVLALAGIGALSASRLSVPSAAILTMAFPIGVAVYYTISVLLFATFGRLDPLHALTATAGLAVTTLLLGFRHRGHQVILLALTACGAAILLAAIARAFHMTRMTLDSMQYLSQAVDLQQPDAMLQVDHTHFLKRQFGLPAVQSLATLTDRAYLASINPIFGVSGLALLAWFSWQHSPLRTRSRRILLTGGVILFALASNRLLFDFFYINTHIQVAVFLLIAISGAWMTVTDNNSSWALAAGMAVSATLLLRPEAALMLPMIFVPLAASRQLNWVSRLAFAIPSMTIATVWFGLLWIHVPGGSEIALTAPVFGSMVVVVGSVLVLALAGRHRFGEALTKLAARTLLPAVLVLGATFAIREPGILWDSIYATGANILIAGRWGATWIFVTPMLVLAYLVAEFRFRRLWTTPLIGFSIVFFLLPFLRDGAWRINAGDSGNRILAHILLAALAFLVLSVPSSDEERPAHDSHPIPS